MDGLKNAHVRDGAAIVQYLVWLDKQTDREAQKLTEVTVSDKLEGFRASNESYVGHGTRSMKSKLKTQLIESFGYTFGQQSEYRQNLDDGRRYMINVPFQLCILVSLYI
ncbi:hypothetical protein RND81_01G112300 [Saponaria officinalis]|uniref:Uncharacterized protein n=1 Tax=Saponaria officinalis TaxID=3572 RepID=A0AAW1ND63_SAPOF